MSLYMCGGQRTVYGGWSTMPLPSVSPAIILKMHFEVQCTYDTMYKF